MEPKESTDQESNETPNFITGLTVVEITVLHRIPNQSLRAVGNVARVHIEAQLWVPPYVSESHLMLCRMAVMPISAFVTFKL
eukprot:7210382-Pyramimonas_sp.AAC.1